MEKETTSIIICKRIYKSENSHSSWRKKKREAKEN